MRFKPIIAASMLIAVSALSEARAQAFTAFATDNIYGSGQPAPAPGGGTSPAASFVVSGGAVATFAIPSTNSVSYNSGGNFNNPDGTGAAVSSSSNNGTAVISGITAPNAGYLVGVFLAAGGPGAGPAPASLVFLNTSFTSLSPLLNQVFFIGDGLTGDGVGSVQSFIAPTDAATLYLGFSDASGYNGDPGAYGDNLGSFSGVATISGVVGVPGPVAGAGLIPLLGLAGTWFSRRRRQRLIAA